MQPDEILTQNAETYRDKNADYGDSWKLAGKTLAMWLQHAGVDELRLPADPDSLNSIGLFTRRLDKLIRSFNAEFVGSELNFESTIDSHEDESTYAAMAASLLRGPDEPMFDPEEIAASIIEPIGFDDAQYVRVPDAHPEYEAAYQELRAGGEQ